MWAGRLCRSAHLEQELRLAQQRDHALHGWASLLGALDLVDHHVRLVLLLLWQSLFHPIRDASDASLFGGVDVRGGLLSELDHRVGIELASDDERARSPRNVSDPEHVVRSEHPGHVGRLHHPAKRAILVSESASQLASVRGVATLDPGGTGDVASTTNMSADLH